MASSVKKEVKTPELIPWMPPGKKDSFNVLTTKKNSKQELPEFGKSNAQDIFGHREDMDESRKTEDARKDMESKILSVLEEDDEESDGDGRRRKRSESADRSRRKDRDSRDKGRSKSEDRRRSRSRRRYERNSRDGDKDEGYDDDYGDGYKSKSKKKGSRKHTKRYNYGTQTSAAVGGEGRSSGATSGLGDSIIEDMEDRRSIQFIEHVNPHMTQFDREYQEGLDPNKNYYPQTQPQNIPPGMVNQGFDPNMQQQLQPPHHGDINPPYGYNQQYPQQQPQFLQQPYPNGNNQFQSLPPNMHMVGPGNQSGTPSPYGFANVNLVGAGPGSNSSQTQEAWLVFPRRDGQNGGGSLDTNGRGSVRSFTARPINFAGSIGSMLKQNFTNINSSKTRSGSGQVEQFNLLEEQDPEVRRESMHRKACWGLVGTFIVLVVLLGIFMIIALVVSSNSSGDPAANKEFVPRTVNNGTGPCSQYAILDERWRNIPSSGVAPQGTNLHCDKPGSASANVKVKAGWYRFEEPAGTYMPTSQHWTGDDAVRVCGTNIVAWMDGNHPKVHEGIVDRRICFQWDSGPCEYKFDTQVRTCEDPRGGTFYVYYLKPPEAGCNYAFCARS